MPAFEIERSLKWAQAVFRFACLELGPADVRSIGDAKLARTSFGSGAPEHLPGNCCFQVTISRRNKRIEGVGLNTLSVLLPVYNAHANLEGAVTDMLEVLGGLGGRFELCILDDGSTDETPEVAHELAARYPQIRVIRHPLRLGLSEAIQTGLDHTQGDVVFVGDEDYQLEPNDLRTLWQLRDVQARQAVGNGSAATGDARLQKLLAWRPRRVRSGLQGNFQVIRRQAFEQVRLQNALEAVRRIDADRGQRSSIPARRPAFLSKVRRFASGESSEQ